MLTCPSLRPWYSGWPELPAQSPDCRVTLEFKGSFSSLWQRNNIAKHLPRESLRGIRAVLGLVFWVIRVPRRIGKYPGRKEAPLFKLNNSLLVGKGLINPSWRRETKFPLLPHSNLILWHEFLTWVAFLPRLVAPGRGWLFKTAGSSSKAYNLMINAYRQLPLLAGPSASLIDSPGDLQKISRCFFERISCLWMQEKDKKVCRHTIHQCFSACRILQGGIPFMHPSWNKFSVPSDPILCYGAECIP